ncbi:MAG: MiaB/RimO family radical SAM methylthiotransferase [Terracidiphilus sp.]|nr:MiaB/RimO family radical SAM methylthiotransferase [Terracidiphilus sp.]MDR3777193.1 MiaB/RimO family radical SAM methylthiotransferase [Terracidiphilus sp.]
MPGFHVENFGCRAARADGEAVGGRLHAAGLCPQKPAEADVVIVNTCSVTAEADRAARAFIRRAHRLNPEARIVVTGCYAQRAPEELAALAGVAAVVGNSHKALAPEIALQLLGAENAAAEREAAAPPALVSVQSLLAGGQAPIWADDRFAHSFLEEAQLAPGSQTRPNLKIQEGCGNRCTFCVIPETRGPSKSLPAAAVLRQVEGFVAAAGNELVFSGINLGRWGRDRAGSARGESRAEVSGLPPSRQKKVARMGHGASLESPAPRTLAALVRQIFEQTALPRLRLSSIEPMDWNADLISLMAEFGGTRLARHAHLPLQSGSDAVLRRMHRRYRPWHYVEKVEALLRAAGPELTLGADVMVGFPGETDAEFEETVALIKALPFGYLHLFPFSPRPGTPAWASHAERPVPAAVVEERMVALRLLAAEKSKAHRRCFVGRQVEAITLHTPSELEARGRTSALTENFLPVEIAGLLAANRLVRLQVTGLNAEGTLEAAAPLQSLSD